MEVQNSYVEYVRNRVLNAFKDLEFVEEGHKYYLHGEELICVSELTHQFAAKFNTEKIAYNYAKKHGNTPEYWKECWRKKSEDASTAGTLVHEFGESYTLIKSGHPELIPESCKEKYKDGVLIPTCPKEEAVLKFWNELPDNYHFVLAETKVFSGINPEKPKLRHNYAGTFDLLCYYEDKEHPENSGLVIFDYKTNAELENAYNRRNGRMLYSPFGTMVDESLSLYTLQLSCYQIPLEDIGLKVVDRRIVWLKDDNGVGKYEIIPVKDVSIRLRAVV